MPIDEKDLEAIKAKILKLDAAIAEITNKLEKAPGQDVIESLKAQWAELEKERQSFKDEFGKILKEIEPLRAQRNRGDNGTCGLGYFE